MRTAFFFGLALVGGLSFAANEFAATADLPANPLPAPFVLPTPPAPPPIVRTNQILRAWGIHDQVAPQPPPGHRYWGTVIARVTAYEPGPVSCGASADGRTSTLRSAWKMDGCAVAPAAIPYGTRVWIPGIGWRLADDTGSAMRKAWKNKGAYHIDVRLPSVAAARRWGSQEIPVILCVPDEVGH